VKPENAGVKLGQLFDTGNGRWVAQVAR